MTTAREMQERCAAILLGWREHDWPEGFSRWTAEHLAEHLAAEIRALPCDESPTALSPDAREALTWLAELDGGLPRAPMPVAGSEECYPGPDVPTRVVSAALRALNREPADKPIGAAGPGDWIIRGVKGELYPCKPDIFTTTYEYVVS